MKISNTINDLKLYPNYDEDLITFDDWCLITIALVTNVAVAIKIVWTAASCAYSLSYYLAHIV
jgi:hypothetical protein